MTEGIIQKVCRGYDDEIALEIARKLIEEIKKLNIHYHKEDVVMTKFLIGDL